MANFNQVTLAGNMTRDVELRHTNSGMAVCDVSLAINDRRKVNGQYVEETVYMDCTLWGRTAEIADQYLGKGSNILITGKLKMDEWEDRSTGSKRQKIKVTVNNMQMLGDGGTPVSGAGKSAAPVTSAAETEGQEEIPF